MSEHRKQSRVKVALYRVALFASIFAAALIVVLWIVSYIRPVSYGWAIENSTGNRGFGGETNLLTRIIWSADGQVGFGREHSPMFIPVAPVGGWSEEPEHVWITKALFLDQTGPSIDPPTFSTKRFPLNQFFFSYDKSLLFVIGIPYWLLFCFSLIAPATIWLGGAWQKRRRLARGECLTCGYDLRESAGDCPECGRPRETVSRPT